MARRTATFGGTDQPGRGLAEALPPRWWDMSVDGRKDGERTKRSVLASGGALAATLALASSAAADTPSPCGQSFDPYAATEAVRAECGIKTFPLRQKIRMDDGSTYYEWNVEGDRVSSILPPPGWNAAKATVEERRRYGIVPAEPPSDPATRAKWEHIMETLKFKAPPDVMMESPIQGAPANTPNETQAGVISYPNDDMTESAIGYTQPAVGSSNCAGGTAKMWTGIDGNNVVAQNGSNLDWPDEGRNQAWYDVTSDMGSMTIPFFATPGMGFKAQVDKTYSFNFGNIPFYRYHFQWYNPDTSNNGGATAPRRSTCTRLLIRRSRATS